MIADNKARTASHAKQRWPNLKIQALIAYARGKIRDERDPFAPALRPVREVLVKLDTKPKPEPSPKKPCVPSLVMPKKTRRCRCLPQGFFLMACWNSAALRPVIRQTTIGKGWRMPRTIAGRKPRLKTER